MHGASGFLLNIVGVILHISDPPGRDHADVVVPLVLVVGATSLDEKVVVQSRQGNGFKLARQGLLKSFLTPDYESRARQALKSKAMACLYSLTRSSD